MAMEQGPQSSCKRFWHYPVIIISLYGCIPDSGQCGPVPAAHKADFYPHFIKKTGGAGEIYINFSSLLDYSHKLIIQEEENGLAYMERSL
jgi:hypothetical protein